MGYYSTYAQPLALYSASHLCFVANIHQMTFPMLQISPHRSFTCSL